jgi:hypothetical protein
VAAVTAEPIRFVSALENVGSSADDPRATLLLVPDRRDPKAPERDGYEQGKTRQQGSEETQEGPRTQSSRPGHESGADGCKHASTKEKVADQGRCHVLHGDSMIVTGHPERAGCWGNALAHRVGSLEDDPSCRSAWLGSRRRVRRVGCQGPTHCRRSVPGNGDHKATWPSVACHLASRRGVRRGRCVSGDVTSGWVAAVTDPFTRCTWIRHRPRTARPLHLPKARAVRGR